MSVKWTLLVSKFMILTAKWHHCLPWTHFSFFPLPASKTVILQKTITKSLFLMISNCWPELGSADTCQVVSVCDCDSCHFGLWSEHWIACPGFAYLHPARSPHCCLCPWAHLFTFLHPIPPFPSTLNSCQSVSYIHASGSILFIHLFYLLESTYKWDHMVFVFVWLTSLSIMLSTSIYAGSKGRSSFFIAV